VGVRSLAASAFWLYRRGGGARMFPVANGVALDESFLREAVNASLAALLREALPLRGSDAAGSGRALIRCPALPHTGALVGGRTCDLGRSELAACEKDLRMTSSPGNDPETKRPWGMR